MHMHTTTHTYDVHICELHRKSVHFGAQSYDTLWLLNGAKRRSTDALHQVFHQRLLPLSELQVKILHKPQFCVEALCEEKTKG